MNVAECKNSEEYYHKSIGIGIGNTFCQIIVTSRSGAGTLRAGTAQLV